MSKLKSVKIENILRVKFAEIEFNDDIVVIGGENGAGKSSVAKAIWMAFAGKKGVPSYPVHEGAPEGTISIELEEGITIDATIKPDRSVKLVLRDAHGKKYANAQEILDSFNFTYGYSPQDFLEANSQKQVDSLLSALGIDLSIYEQEANRLYLERRDINRDVASLAARYKAMAPYSAELGEVETSVEDTLADLRQAREHNEQVERMKAQAKRTEADIANAKKRIEALQAEILRLKTEVKALELPVAKPIAELVDISEIESRLLAEQTRNQKVRENRRAKEVRDELTRVEKISGEYSAALNEIQAKKKALLNSADLSIDGLSILEDRLLYNGFPLDQASDAEQWAVAIAIGFAMKPKLKLVYVRHGSLLSPKTRQLVYELTKKHGGQLLFEVVGEPEDATIIMEDGEVRA